MSNTETQIDKPICIRDFPRSDALNEMISQSCWDPINSGWRPFQSSKEASVLIGEKIELRGSNWNLKVISLGETGAVFEESLSYSDSFTREKVVPYTELFRFYKVSNGNIPCGMPK